MYGVHDTAINNVSEYAGRGNKKNLLPEWIASPPSHNHTPDERSGDKENKRRRTHYSVFTQHAHIATVRCVMKCLLRLAWADAEGPLSDRFQSHLLRSKTVAVVAL